MVLDRIGYELVFPREETKTRARLQYTFPDELVSHLQRFLQVHRPQLLRQMTDHRALWIGQGGRPLSPMAFHHRICEITHERMGAAIPPHLFRDAAATSISIEDPQFVAIAQVILGHTTDRNTRRHYVHARSLEASRRLQACLLRRRHRGSSAG